MKIVRPGFAKNIIIQGTGMGMNKQELITNLGTIAKSGTKNFIESMTNTNSDISMIGQFGVGFYSAYLVANKVDVISKNNDDVCYKWESTAGGSFNIAEFEDATMTRGTKMILHLKEDMDKYLEESTIKELIKKHNQFISFPIYLECQKTKEVEVEQELEQKDIEKGESDTKVEDVEESEEKSKKTKTETYYEYDHLNQERPIWLRKPEEVSQEEYVSFYKNISNDHDEHMDVSHFSVEGNIEFKGLLYIPLKELQKLLSN